MVIRILLLWCLVSVLLGATWCAVCLHVRRRRADLTRVSGAAGGMQLLHRRGVSS